MITVLLRMLRDREREREKERAREKIIKGFWQ